MKKTIMLSMLAILGGIGFASAANAQAQGLTCDDLVWQPNILTDNPTINEACLGVVERNGQPVAKFKARVVRQSVNSTIFQWQKPDGSWTDAQRRFPDRGFMAEVGDQPVRILDLTARQEVNVYVPAGDVWAAPAAEEAPAAPVAAAAAPVAAAVVAEPEPEPEPAMLPTTATQVPMLALLGGLLVLLGGAVGFVRTRL